MTTWYILKRRICLEGMDENPMPEYWTKRETDEFVAARKEEMDVVNINLFRAVCRLFDSPKEVF